MQLKMPKFNIRHISKDCSSLWIVFSGSLVQDRRRIHHSSFPLSLRAERRTQTDGGTTDPAHPLGPVSPAVAAHLPRASERESEGALCRARAERCTSAAAVYLMLIPAAATTESALLLLLDRKGTNGGREESSNRFGQGAGESCRATDDNAVT